MRLADRGIKSHLIFVPADAKGQGGTQSLSCCASTCSGAPDHLCTCPVCGFCLGVEFQLQMDDHFSTPVHCTKHVTIESRDRLTTFSAENKSVILVDFERLKILKRLGLFCLNRYLNYLQSRICLSSLVNIIIIISILY